MANSSVAITAGSGTTIDTFLPANSQHRQSVVVADPATTAGAAGVVNSTPGSTDYGLEVRDVVTPTISTNLGTTTDAAVTGNGSLIAITKQLRTLLNGGLPSALGQSTMANSLTVTLASDNKPTVQGDVGHGSSNSGNPLQTGYEAIAHGTNPTAVTAGQRTKAYANRAGVPFVMGGHPNVKTIELAFTAAQTDVAIVTVATGLKIVVTECEVLCSHANSVDVAVRIGFGTSTTPTTTGVVLTHPNIAAGSGVIRGNGSGILGVGADDEDLRITATVPTSGSARALVSYYTIES